jgi:polyhydroxyalkanoate synthesis regulator phasin
MEKQLPREGQASASDRSKQRIVAVLSEEQGKDIKAATAEVTRLKSEIAALRDLIERRTSELQSGVPVVRKP